MSLTLGIESRLDFSASVNVLRYAFDLNSSYRYVRMHWVYLSSKSKALAVFHPARLFIIWLKCSNALRPTTLNGTCLTTTFMCFGWLNYYGDFTHRCIVCRVLRTFSISRIYFSMLSVSIKMRNFFHYSTQRDCVTAKKLYFVPSEFFTLFCFEIFEYAAPPGRENSCWRSGTHAKLCWSFRWMHFNEIMFAASQKRQVDDAVWMKNGTILLLACGIWKCTASYRRSE